MCAVALNEGCGAEVLKARPRGAQGLTTSFPSSGRVHNERVTNPETAPAGRTLRDAETLTVDCHHVANCLTNCTSGNVRNYILLSNRHHGNGLIGGQPVGLVIARCVVADIIQVTEQERHGIETLYA